MARIKMGNDERRRSASGAENRTFGLLPLSIIDDDSATQEPLWPGIDPVQHQIDNHTGDRDIKPNGKSPTRDFAVSYEVTVGRAIQRHKDKRDNHNGQYSMANQNSEIYGPHDSLPCEARSAMVIMIRQVRSEKQCGCDKS